MDEQVQQPGRASQRGMIDVLIDHTPATVEYAVKPDSVLMTGIAPVARGPVRLVIDMPTRSARLVASTLMTALALFIMVGVELALFASLPSPVGSAPPAAISARFAALIVFFLGAALWFSRAGVRRERLEIDSRFVTLSRGTQTLVTAPRGACDAVTVTDAPASGLPAWLADRFSDTAWLRFGSDPKRCVSAGSGISRQSAERLAGVVRDFMEEHPVEAGFEGRETIVRPFGTEPTTPRSDPRDGAPHH
jgi:hypothetical protein